VSFLLGLNWEKSCRRSEREKVKIFDRTLDRTRRCSTTMSGSGHHLRVRSREGGSYGPLTGRWTGCDAARPLHPVLDITCVSGHTKMALKLFSDQTLSTSILNLADASGRPGVLCCVSVLGPDSVSVRSSLTGRVRSTSRPYWTLTGRLLSTSGRSRSASGQWLEKHISPFFL
jgi:hypothetical protein